MLSGFDRKIKKIKFSVIFLQSITVLGGLGFSLITTLGWLRSIRKSYKDGFDLWANIYIWSTEYDWQRDSGHSLIVAACLNSISLAVIFTGLILIRNWIVETFDG